MPPKKLRKASCKTSNPFDVVCITSNYQLLGCAACEQEQPFLDYLQRDLETLLSEKFCLNNKKLTVLTSYQALPLANDTATIGYLCVGHIVAEKNDCL